MDYARIAETGNCIPTHRTLENSDLVDILRQAHPDAPDKWTTDDWIVSRTGIKRRQIAAPDQSNDVLGAEALTSALKRAGWSPADLEFIICATNTNETNFPACAGKIQAAIGGEIECGFYDIQGGCTSFVQAVATGSAFIQSGMYKRIAVVGTDVLSRITDYRERETCVLFGDLACAWLLEANPTPGIIRSVLKGKGNGHHLIGLTPPDAARIQERREGKQTGPIFTTGQGYLSMNGREVYRFAKKALAEACLDVLNGTPYELQDVDWIFPHNANLRIIEAAVEKLAQDAGLPAEQVAKKFYHTIERYGNASAGSNANSFHEARVAGLVKPGELVIIVGFGAGLTYGANLFRL